MAMWLAADRRVGSETALGAETYDKCALIRSERATRETSN
jgi:hypothetical protein